MKISFCMPEDSLPTAATRAAWEKGEFASFKDGDGNASTQSWLYQTWLLLKKNGVDCQLCTYLEEEGIIFLVGATLDTWRRPPKTSFFVDIVSDGVPHPGADLHLVQNKTYADLLNNALFMPHWPQPYLVKRDPLRGDRFENVAFFGDPYNLASEFHSAAWSNLLSNELGLTFHIHGANRWHDYSKIDCAIALRNFSDSIHLNKPGAKLYNAWLAEVPFIGGRDSAYAADGEAWKNYLMATSVPETFAHLKRLQMHPELRTKLVEEGLKRSPAFSQAATLMRWHELIHGLLPRLAKLKAAGLRG